MPKIMNKKTQTTKVLLAKLDTTTDIYDRDDVCPPRPRPTHKKSANVLLAKLDTATDIYDRDDVCPPRPPPASIWFRDLSHPAVFP
jgi:hypothetical protein